MESINNLNYSIQINYINNSGKDVSICKKINDDGLELNSIKVGDICISEETIKGRVLSGRYDNSNIICGYKYNYEKSDHEYLVNINKDVLLETAINMINKTKMQSDFLLAKMVISAILRNDYKVFSIKKGNLTITKTATVETENKESCFVQETVCLFKEEDEESFSEIKKETICKVNEDCVLLNKDNINNDIKIKLKELFEIIDENPNCYKDLEGFKHLNRSCLF